MDVRFNLVVPQIVPQIVPDLRPAAHAAATARENAPPAAVSFGPNVGLTSPSQEALVARSRLGVREVSAASSGDGAGPTADRPARVLNPWGVPMLPDEGRQRAEALAAAGDGTGAAGLLGDLPTALPGARSAGQLDAGLGPTTSKRVPTPGEPRGQALAMTVEALDPAQPDDGRPCRNPEVGSSA